MKVIVWGTGKYFIKYKNMIDSESILFFVDEDKSKHGKLIEKKIICPPEDILKANYDYILVMIKDYKQILCVLNQLKIEESKVKLFNQLGEVYHNYYFDNSLETIKNWLNNNLKRQIAVFFPSFSLTGAPIAMLNLTLKLRELGWNVMAFSIAPGRLEEKLEENKITYINDITPLYDCKKFLEYLNLFQMFFLGCTVLSDVGNSLKILKKPICWWIHESLDVMYKGFDLPMADYIKYYGVGNKVLDKFRNEYPEGQIENLYYSLPEVNCKKKRNNDRRCVAIIGTVNRFKAQDIFLKALDELDNNIRNKAKYFIVGKLEDDSVIKLLSKVGKKCDIKYIGELSQDELETFYDGVDILVCPSRTDSMPIVVSEAIQRGIACIVSDQVGQSSFIKEYPFGEVFHSEDVRELSKLLQKMIAMSNDDLLYYSFYAKQIYDLYFSEKNFKKNISIILNDLLN